MDLFKIADTELTVSRIGLGCMRIADLDKQSMEHLIHTAIDCGINFFDHADIYGDGRSEEVFSQVIGQNGICRDKMVIQSKCGIRRGFYDLSKEYILSSVDGILDRLKTDYIDILLLHRPDALIDPQEVTEAFEKLHASGKVRYFGVSNQNSSQIELLQKHISYKIIINQLQMSITNASMISTGLNVNMENDSAINRDGGILDYCRLKNITMQAWSPLQYGFFQGTFLGSDKYVSLNQTIDRLAMERGVSSAAIAIEWLLRHPATIQPIVGTRNAKRLKDICQACDVHLTRQEWYEIFCAAGNILP